jgi:hypothetical protein
MKMTTEKQLNFVEVITRYESDLQGTTANLLEATIQALDHFRNYCAQGGLLERKAPDQVREHWYTRFASALTQYFVKPETALNQEGLEKLAFRKQVIAYIFAASGYRDMSHLISLMTKDNGTGKRNLSTTKAMLLLSVIGIDDVSDELMTLTLKQKPGVLFPLMLGWLNQRAVLTAQGEKNRTRLLTSGALVESLSVSDRHLPQMVRPWMYCSYASTPKKHDIKAAFNKLFLKRLADAGVKPFTVAYQSKPRPRVLVIHERFNSNHAMHRCYAPLIRTLKPNFELVALADAAEIDGASDVLFDKVHSFNPKKLPIAAIVKQVQALKPDIIYYPSLGMQPWTVLIANLRLAPIQIASQGHPATTRSDCIDYIFVNDMPGDLTQVYSERVLVGNEDALFEEHADLPSELPKRTRVDDGYVHIAVNSKVMKLSHRLLDVCKRLIKEAKYPLKFHFFPGERGLYYDGISAMIKSQIPDSRVLPYLNYPSFLQEIKNCDLSLAAFPFGNTNGTVDTCLLGVPTIAHFGTELPAQTDLLVLNMAGYPKWLVNDNDEAYFEAALRLVNSPELRHEVATAVHPEIVKERIICAQHEISVQPLGQMVHYVYKNHHHIQASNERVIRYAEIKSEVGQ